MGHPNISLLANNIPDKYIQKQVGHSSIQVTMDIYGHIMPETAEQSVKVLDSLFKKDQPNTPKHMKVVNWDICR